MWFLYAQWRYRGQDPSEAVHPGAEPGPRYESLLAAFAVYAARLDEANVTMGKALGG